MQLVVIVVQSRSHVWLFATPWTAAHQASLSLTISWSWLKFIFVASVMPSNHIILWCPLLLLPSVFPSIRDFSDESSVCIRWPKYCSFSFCISPSSEYSGLISLKIDGFGHLAIQGNFRSLLQHHSSKASVLWHPASFIVQLSQPNVTTGKTIALTIQTFVGRVMSLLFNNTLSRFVIVFPPKSNSLLISWLQSLSAVILEPKKRKSVTTSTFSLSICYAVMGPGAMILVFLLFKPALSLFSFTLIKRLFSSFSPSAFRAISSAYLRLLIFLLPILIPAYNSSSPAFLIMCLGYRLNKQDDSRQPCHTPFSILNQSVVPYRVLTVVSWPAYRFLRRQVRWSVIPISLRATHSLPFHQRHVESGFKIHTKPDLSWQSSP